MPEQEGYSSAGLRPRHGLVHFRAIPPILQRLSPFDPQNFLWYDVLALARLFSGPPLMTHNRAGRTR